MIYCPACGAPVLPSSYSEELNAARCAQCKKLFEPGSDNRKPARSVARGAAMPVPEGWVVEDLGSGALEVRWKWARAAAFVLIPFTVFWNGILVSMAVSTDTLAHPVRLLLGLAIPHVWVGLGLAYYCCALLLNTTTVRCAQGKFTVRQGPLPWPGNKTIEVGDLRQLFVVERRGGKGSLSYELCGLLEQDRKLTLLKSLDSADKARFLEVRFEQALEITDAPVLGELPR
jgi:hypothetical protein